MQQNFQDGVDSIYNACVAKGSTPASQSLSDVVAGIMAIPTGITPSGTLSITSNGTKDVTNYASANVNVPNSNSGTYTPTTRSSALDMGAANTYRYVNTNSVPNSNSGTYKATSRSTSIDMGATNTYRYVNTSGVTQTGTYKATSRSTSIDMGATNNYRYVNTSGVLQTGTYTASSSSKALDMGATNTYRYVNTSALTKVSGNKSITANGTNIDVKSYATVSVSVANTVSVIVADAFDNRSKSSDYTFTRASGYAYTIAVHADGGTVQAYGIINSAGTIQSWAGSTDYFSLTRNSATSFTISKTSGSDNYSGFIFRAL